MHLKDNLNRLVDFHGLSLETLSTETGIPKSDLAKFLSGIEPKASALILLAKSLKVSIDRLLCAEIWPVKKQAIKLLVLDVDGVMTDGGMYVTESGEEMKKYQTKDGRGIIDLQRAGTPVAILSGSLNAEGIYKRASILGVDRVFAGRHPKTEILQGWMDEMGIGYADIAFVGDDLNDLGVIAKAGLTACPADAVDAVKQQVDIVLTNRGGHGAVREFIELYLA